MPAFLRLPYLAIAAVGTIICAFVIPINMGPAGKVFVLGVIWFALAYFLWTLADLAAHVKERRTRQIAPLPVGRHPPASVGAAVPEREGVDVGELRRCIEILHREGVLAPDAPPVEMLIEAAADYGGPASHDVVLMSLHEVEYHHDGFDITSCMENLAFHTSHSEQDAEAIGGQISELVRLSRGRLAVESLTIATPLDGTSREDGLCTIDMQLNGVPMQIEYAAAMKYLSTHLHVALACALRDAGSDLRLAWLWNDQGAWICALPAGAVERLNADAVSDVGGFGAWEWVDDAEPIAAGESVGG